MQRKVVVLTFVFVQNYNFGKKYLFFLQKNSNKLTAGYCYFAKDVL